MAIRQFSNSGSHQKALERIQLELSQTTNPEFKAELLTRRLNIEYFLGNRSVALQTCDALYDEDPNNVYYLLERARSEQSQEKRLASISRAIEIDPYYSSAYRLRAEFYEEQLENDPKCNFVETIAAIHKDYQASLRVNPSLGNPSWIEYCEYLLSNRREPKQQRLAVVDNLLKRLEELDAYSQVYFKVAVEYAETRDAGASPKLETIKKVKAAITMQPRSRKKSLELVCLQALKKFEMRSELLSEVQSFDADERWSQDKAYTEIRARNLRRR
jgi:tetratricopeptide (TPR) repeat protein